MSGFQPWQVAVIIVGNVVVIVFFCAVMYLADRAVKKNHKDQAALREELNPTDNAPDKRRLEVAIQVADSGYLVCPKCAFENFTTVKSCTICKTPLVVAPKTSK